MELIRKAKQSKLSKTYQAKKDLSLKGGEYDNYQDF